MKHKIYVQSVLKVVYTIIVLSLARSSAAQGNAPSPYAIFGDNTATLESETEYLCDIQSQRICNSNNAMNIDGISSYAKMNILIGGRMIFTTVDPKAEDYYNVSPYIYCADNPINAIDHDGQSTWVLNKGNGIYSVVGGRLDDNDKNIYQGYYEKGKFIKTNSIGITTSITSFYNSDNDGGKWSIGSEINMNDNSGDLFLNRIISNNPPMLDDYIPNARNNHPYDFKVTNGTSRPINGIDIYRGMPIGVTGNGKKIITSARDIGNIAAGYEAGMNGMTWEMSRIAFDGYQKGVEGISTRNAEWYGWRMGYNNSDSTHKLNTFMRSVGSALSTIWDYITK